MSNNKTYQLGFTAGGLFLREGPSLAGLCLELGGIPPLRERILADNLLQARTQSSLKRLCREVLGRLEQLREDELRFLSDATLRDCGYLLWLAACRRYRILADFAVEVLHERFLTLKPNLPEQEFTRFFSEKSQFHTELAELSSSTTQKLRQVLFRMLREAGLLDKACNIIPAIPGLKLTEFLRIRREYVYFPMNPPLQREDVA